MPLAMARACATLGCDQPAPCRTHQHQPRQRYNQQRGSASSRGYIYRWTKARLGHLDAHPLCVECHQQGYITAATEVDHIIPHRGDQHLFWDQSNWQSLCRRHHAAKTLRGQ